MITQAASANREGADWAGADWAGAVERARACSPFLALAMRRLPEIALLCEQGHGEAALAAARALGEQSADQSLETALRRERLGFALVLGLGDLAGAFPLAFVMDQLTALADRALDRAIGAVIARRVDKPTEGAAGHARASGFTALALGKQGAGELNYSSDIDPILLFNRERLPRRPRDEPDEVAQLYARRIVALLGQQTGDGYVFRVDLRLRPDAEVTPLAISFAAALTHYESAGLAWERAAFIRARPAAGDIAAGEAFLGQISPFIWRGNLDFTALEEIRRLTARIRSAHEGPRLPGPGFDVKRGRGGIREIEFFAQTHQLIYGGRNPALRLRGTRQALDALAAQAIIPGDTARDLGEAYDRLRVIEHRLQMVDDRQVHALPTSEAALDNVARLEGLSDGAPLVAELVGLTDMVAARYDGLLGEDKARRTAPPRLDAGREEVRAATAFEERFGARIARWPKTIRALKSKEALAAYDAIRPDLLVALAGARDPSRALARWEQLLDALPSAINMFRLFEQRPALLERVLHVLTLASPLADELARRVALLDALIDGGALDLPGDITSLAERMTLAGDAGYEARLDRIRMAVGEERFMLGVQLIEAHHDPLAIAEGLCRVAEAALQVGAKAAIAKFAEVHGRIADGELVILGLGRLGGGALTHASDLDLVYLFTGEIGRESTGPRPLTASLYFNRLASRVSSALSVPTAEGALYEVDTRLRPQGVQGPLAVSTASFANYQARDAWTWEHMALARARPILGSPAARDALARTIRGILGQPRDPGALRTAVLAMRAEMAVHKPPKGPLDVKRLRGGLVDLEFIVHFLQLREGVALEPALENAIAALCQAGLLPDDFARHMAVLIRILVSARLLAPDGELPPPAPAKAMARACGGEDMPALLQRLAGARQGVAQVWAELFGEKLETRT